jgi:flagellar biosynthesis/type III secretory pathway M-ring protein FliF/YscJ
MLINNNPSLYSGTYLLNMHLSLYIGLLIILLLVAVTVAILFRRKKYSYTALYAEGVKNENNGRFVAALQNYSTVLAEIKNYRFHQEMKEQLTDKIKVLRSAIEYESH